MSLLLTVPYDFVQSLGFTPNPKDGISVSTAPLLMCIDTEEEGSATEQSAP